MPLERWWTTKLQNLSHEPKNLCKPAATLRHITKTTKTWFKVQLLFIIFGSPPLFCAVVTLHSQQPVFDSLSQAQRELPTIYRADPPKNALKMNGNRGRSLKDCYAAKQGKEAHLNLSLCGLSWANKRKVKSYCDCVCVLFYWSCHFLNPL